MILCLILSASSNFALRKAMIYLNMYAKEIHIKIVKMLFFMREDIGGRISSLVGSWYA